MSTAPTLDGFMTDCLAIITRILECFLFCVIDTLPILFPLVSCRLLDTLWFPNACFQLLYVHCGWNSYALNILDVFDILFVLSEGKSDVVRKRWRWNDIKKPLHINIRPAIPSPCVHSECLHVMDSTIWVGIFWMRVITCIDVSFLGSTTYSWQAGACISF